jgi:hypothetical protein
MMFEVLASVSRYTRLRLGYQTIDGEMIVKQPLILSYGMGVDSTAIIVGMVNLGIRPDLVIFADVGGEREDTYAFGQYMAEYLRGHDWPEITTVRYTAKNFKHWPPYYTLEENCLTNGTLPSKAFGFGSCSLKWKASPIHAYAKQWAPAIEAWNVGLKVRKAIGYDCSARDVQRRTKADKFISTYKDPYADKYDYWYPLQDWDWDRDECMRQIAMAGLPVPPKSSCFYCPAMKPWEVDTLSEDHLRRIVLMEARAMPRLTKVQGLWRTATKKRPGSITEYIEATGLLPQEEIDRIKQVPTDLIDYQEGFRNGHTSEAFSAFLERVLSPIKESIAC